MPNVIRVSCIKTCVAKDFVVSKLSTLSAFFSVLTFAIHCY